MFDSDGNIKRASWREEEELLIQNGIEEELTLREIVERFRQTFGKYRTDDSIRSKYTKTKNKIQKPKPKKKYLRAEERIESLSKRIHTLVKQFETGLDELKKIEEEVKIQEDWIKTTLSIKDRMHYNVDKDGTVHIKRHFNRYTFSPSEKQD